MIYFCSLNDTESVSLSQVSEVLTTFGQRVLVQPTAVDEYRQKYKGIWICLLILMRALAGNYVIFGVFELYGDPALNVSKMYIFHP